MIEGRISPVEHRHDTILGSGTTLKVLAGAYFIAAQLDVSAAEMTERFADIDFAPDNPFWAEIGFVTGDRATPNARLQQMKAASNEIARLLAAKD